MDEFIELTKGYIKANRIKSLDEVIANPWFLRKSILSFPTFEKSG